MHYWKEISFSGRKTVFGHIQQALSQDLKVEPRPKVSAEIHNFKHRFCMYVVFIIFFVMGGQLLILLLKMFGVNTVRFLVSPYLSVCDCKHCCMCSAKCSNSTNLSWLPLQLWWQIVKAKGTDSGSERRISCYTPRWKYSQHLIQLSIGHRCIVFWSSEHYDISYHCKI